MKPQKQINGITFFPVPEFTNGNEEKFFERRDLPEIPRNYEDMAQTFFFDGGQLPELHPSVDRTKATKAIEKWLGSFLPAHEAKIATVGYALWLWTDPDVLNEE